MNKVERAQWAIRVLPVALALGLLAWRCAMDGPPMSAREWRDTIQAGLLTVLPWQFLRAVEAPNRLGFRFALVAPLTVLAVVAGLGLNGIFMYNGYVAHRYQQCVAAAHAAAPMAQGEPRAAEAQCKLQRLAE